MCASNLGWSVSKLSLLIILVSTSFGNYSQVLLTIFELVLTWYNHLLVEAILAGLGDLVRRPCVCSRRPCARAGPVRSAPPSPRLRQLGICRRVLILAACLRVVFGFWLSYGRVARPEVRAIYGQP